METSALGEFAAIVTFFSFLIGLFFAIVFIIMAWNIGTMTSTLKNILDEQQKIYKALYQIAKIKIEERAEVDKKPQETR